jgi:hypothetical protein
MLLAAVVKPCKSIERRTVNASVLAVDHHEEQVGRRRRVGCRMAERIERDAAEGSTADFDPKCRWPERGNCPTSRVLPGIRECPRREMVYEVKLRVNADIVELRGIHDPCHVSFVF